MVLGARRPCAGVRRFAGVRATGSEKGAGQRRRDADRRERVGGPDLVHAATVTTARFSGVSRRRDGVDVD
jgi:hypothetical protein